MPVADLSPSKVADAPVAAAPKPTKAVDPSVDPPANGQPADSKESAPAPASVAKAHQPEHTAGSDSFTKPNQQHAASKDNGRHPPGVEGDDSLPKAKLSSDQHKQRPPLASGNGDTDVADDAGTGGDPKSSSHKEPQHPAPEGQQNAAKLADKNDNDAGPNTPDDQERQRPTPAKGDGDSDVANYGPASGDSRDTTHEDPQHPAQANQLDLAKSAGNNGSDVGSGRPSDSHAQLPGQGGNRQASEPANSGNGDDGPQVSGSTNNQQSTQANKQKFGKVLDLDQTEKNRKPEDTSMSDMRAENASSDQMSEIHNALAPAQQQKDWPATHGKGPTSPGQDQNEGYAQSGKAPPPHQQQNNADASSSSGTNTHVQVDQSPAPDGAENSQQDPQYNGHVYGAGVPSIQDKRPNLPPAAVESNAQPKAQSQGDAPPGQHQTISPDQDTGGTIGQTHRPMQAPAGSPKEQPASQGEQKSPPEHAPAVPPSDSPTIAQGDQHLNPQTPAEGLNPQQKANANPSELGTTFPPIYSPNEVSNADPAPPQSGGAEESPAHEVASSPDTVSKLSPPQENDNADSHDTNPPNATNGDQDRPSAQPTTNLGDLIMDGFDNSDSLSHPSTAQSPTFAGTAVNIATTPSDPTPTARLPAGNESSAVGTAARGGGVGGAGATLTGDAGGDAGAASSSSAVAVAEGGAAGLGGGLKWCRLVMALLVVGLGVRVI